MSFSGAWKAIVSFCVEAMRKDLLGFLKYRSTTKASSFLQFSESFHVMGLLLCEDTLCKADVLTEFCNIKGQVVLVLYGENTRECACMCY